MTSGTLPAPLAALVGRSLTPGGPRLGPDPVNQPMIHHWVAAFEDANPVYVDAGAAAPRFGTVVAPPLMLQTWTMPTPVITGIAERGGSPTVSAGDSFMTVFDDAGYPGTLACNSEFEILRYLHPGQHVAAETILESISEQKRTRLGPGHFVTWVTSYADSDGTLLGRQRFRVLKFAPQQRGNDGPSQETPGPPVAAAPKTDEGGAGGQTVAPMVLAMTATRIVAGALATRDFMPVHHDRAYAQAQGAPDIFMNILSTNAYCSRFLTDWAGPDTMLRRLSIRLGVPVHPGSTLTFTGSVTDRRRVEGEELIDVALVAAVDAGPHAHGSATIALPVGVPTTGAGWRRPEQDPTP